MKTSIISMEGAEGGIHDVRRTYDIDRCRSRRRPSFYRNSLVHGMSYGVVASALVNSAVQ